MLRILILLLAILSAQTSHAGLFSWYPHNANPKPADSKSADPKQADPNATEPPPPPGNPQHWKFTTAVRKIAEISKFNPVTVYCGCQYRGNIVDLASCGFVSHHKSKRTNHIEWEHVAAAESFGQSFVMWRKGDTKCSNKRKGPYAGRKCAEKDSEFLRMETDLYNLWPIIGELNVLRSNFSFAELTGSDYNFGGCKVKIQDRKIEPMDEYKGVVARAHKYMDLVYPHHGIISEKNKPLFNTWDAAFPVTDWECQRADLIKEVQGNANPILVEACEKQH
jgi:deoxyribonuclease-1